MAGRTSAPRAIDGFETGQGQGWIVLGPILTIHVALTWVRPREFTYTHPLPPVLVFVWSNLSPWARLVHGCGNPQWEGAIYCDFALSCHA